MNSQLRKAIKNMRNLLRQNLNLTEANQRVTGKDTGNGEIKYLSNRCKESKSGKEFWNTVKQLLSTKTTGTDCDIVLKEEGNVANVQNSVCKLLLYQSC